MTKSRISRATKTHKPEQRSLDKAKPNPCPKCCQAMVSRTKHETVISQCLSCGSVARRELSYD